MPRPTPVQLAAGSATVVFSTFALLVLSDVRSGPAVVALACAGLLLGLLVSVSLSLPRLSGRRGQVRTEDGSGDGQRRRVPVGARR